MLKSINKKNKYKQFVIGSVEENLVKIWFDVLKEVYSIDLADKLELQFNKLDDIILKLESEFEDKNINRIK